MFSGTRLSSFLAMFDKNNTVIFVKTDDDMADDLDDDIILYTSS